MMLLAHASEPAGPLRAPLSGGPAIARGTGIEIVLDLSRLLSRVLHPSPTGVDRVELAYARTLKRLAPGRLQFGAVHPSGFYGRLSPSCVEAFLDRTEHRWERVGADEPAGTSRLLGLSHCWSLRPRGVDRPRRPRVVLQVSPHHLDRPWTVRRKLEREQARFVCLVHDLIPISHPEYARPNGAERHARRLRTIEALADGVLTNSQATLESLVHRPGAAFRERPMRVAHLGIDVRNDREASAPGAPAYFVCVATIEPRKNHLLLLNVWRSIVEMIGPQQTPQLFLVGRRGWENENILDILDRCPALRGVVHELPRLADAELRTLVRGSRALLMPSFAEGFGLPVAEGLAAGVPVLASDIPAHREAGGGVPEYLDPIDGAAWRSAVLAYHAPANSRRSAQLERLAHWRPVSWEQHVETALSLIDEVAR